MGEKRLDEVLQGRTTSNNVIGTAQNDLLLIAIMDHSPFKLNIDLVKENDFYYHSWKEHLKR